MTVVVFTPTYRPGSLDILEASLTRQIFKDFVWLVSDQRYFKRKHVWDKIKNSVDFPIITFCDDIKEGNKRNLCSSYNEAAEFVVKQGADMLISLQDYIYLPADGIHKFVKMDREWGPNLFTGVTHISEDPYPNKIKYPEGDYTIFEQPYTEKPKRLSWTDVRVTEIYSMSPDICEVETGHWEANWAAVSREVLEADKGMIRWDESYDKGIAYENMDFAQQAAKIGYSVYLDKNNVAISLPHKDYFPGEREEIVKFSNREYYEKKWLH